MVMTVYKIDSRQWREGLEKLSRDYRLIAPKNQKDGACEFQRLEAGELPDIPVDNTRLSPKFVAFPQTETLLTYSIDDKDPDCGLMKEPDMDCPPTAVVGIRPCDARALTLVRLNFDTPDYQDPYWLKKYERLVLVGFACDAPCPTCFCTSTGGGPYDEKGLDMLVARQNDVFLAKVLTDKGRKLVEAAGWQDASGDPGVFEAGRQAAEARIVSRVPTDQLAGKSLLELHAAPFWDDIAFACLNCGTCTFLCPTCWCFDIQDETFRKHGARLRNWDSCMFPLFTQHTTGHNPRGEKVQRVRQRFMHKLKYFPDKYGQGIMCTGCGRCVRYCPVNIDIRRVCEEMNGYAAEKKSA